MKAWNVKQIAGELQNSYTLCNNEFERSMWRVYVASDIKGVIGDRGITPGEQSILDLYKIIL